ncbi:unnamed protein product [Colias eurytheme]|nr:unnamed protein product [Colias eurytheme]
MWVGEYGFTIEIATALEVVSCDYILLQYIRNNQNCTVHSITQHTEGGGVYATDWYGHAVRRKVNEHNDRRRETAERWRRKCRTSTQKRTQLALANKNTEYMSTKKLMT